MTGVKMRKFIVFAMTFLLVACATDTPPCPQCISEPAGYQPSPQFTWNNNLPLAKTIST